MQAWAGASRGRGEESSWVSLIQVSVSIFGLGAIARPTNVEPPLTHTHIEYVLFNFQVMSLSDNWLSQNMLPNQNCAFQEDIYFKSLLCN